MYQSHTGNTEVPKIYGVSAWTGESIFCDFVRTSLRTALNVDKIL